MSLKHKVRISVSRPERKSEVIRSGSREVRGKLLNWLFGEKVGVFVLTPGKTVETVEIQEMPEGGEDDDA
jgi:hypothetical protein